MRHAGKPVAVGIVGLCRKIENTDTWGHTGVILIRSQWGLAGCAMECGGRRGHLCGRHQTDSAVPLATDFLRHVALDNRFVSRNHQKGRPVHGESERRFYRRWATAGLFVSAFVLAVQNQAQAQTGGYAERRRDNPYEVVAPAPTTPPYWQWTNPFACDKNKECPEGQTPDGWKEPPGFCQRFLDANISDNDYYDGYFADNPNPPARRGMPEAFSSPPYPGNEWQGYPLIGAPPGDFAWPLMKAVYGGSGEWAQAIKDSKIQLDGWITTCGNYSTSNNSNLPSAYWIVPNGMQIDQTVLRLHREVDSVQTDHWDWGFRSIGLYGIDYRYTTAGGWLSNQLLRNNSLNGFDPVEQFFEVYIPGIMEGLNIRVGRWIACPDIENQYSVDNYLGSHSLLFTFDTYTQTGIMGTIKLNDQWHLQAAIHSGTDMAPWYGGATPTGAFGFRWVASDNRDALYCWLNAINNAHFRTFTRDGILQGHDNFNYAVGTWEHKFDDAGRIVTKTESYYMWQFDAFVGGTPSFGIVRPFGGGGGFGAPIPGLSQTFGVLNYTMLQVSKQDYFTIRNEYWVDQQGERSGFAGQYSSHTIGISHKFNALVMVRPEIGYYRNYDQPAFDLGTSKGMLMAGFDFTYRF